MSSKDIKEKLDLNLQERRKLMLELREARKAEKAAATALKK